MEYVLHGPEAAKTILWSSLEFADGVWITSIEHDGPEHTVEVSVRGKSSSPESQYVDQAAACIASIDDLRPKLEQALNSVPETDPLFPPVATRVWYLETIAFVNDDPTRGVASFSLTGNGYDFIYVQYVVGFEGDRVISATAKT
jgi:hypothetical protein